MKIAINIIFGLFVLFIGADIFFSRPFITRGFVVPPIVGVLFWLWGGVILFIEVRKVKQNKSNKRKQNPKNEVKP
jgi:hypothetical protein